MAAEKDKRLPIIRDHQGRRSEERERERERERETETEKERKREKIKKIARLRYRYVSRPESRYTVFSE